MSETGHTLRSETFPVGPLQCNCTLIADSLTRRAIVVDPGGDPERILARIDALGLDVVSIVHTHAHLDHFLASGQIKERTGATLVITGHGAQTRLGDEMRQNPFIRA